MAEQERITGEAVASGARGAINRQPQRADHAQKSSTKAFPDAVNFTSSQDNAANPELTALLRFDEKQKKRPRMGWVPARSVRKLLPTAG